MTTVLLGAIIAMGIWADGMARPPERPDLGGLPDEIVIVCGQWPMPAIDDTTVALQLGVLALPGGAMLEPHIRHQRLLLFLICQDPVDRGNDVLRLQAADFEEDRLDVREALVQLDAAAGAGLLSMSQASSLVRVVANCSYESEGAFPGCVDRGSRASASAFHFGPPLLTPVPPPTVPPTVVPRSPTAVPSATFLPPTPTDEPTVTSSVTPLPPTATPSLTAAPSETPFPSSTVAALLAAVAPPTGSGTVHGMTPSFGDIANAETWLAVIAVLVAVLVVMAAAAFCFYLLGAYFRAIDVRGRIRGTGAEARREMDDLSRQHLGAVAAAIHGETGGNDP